MPVVVRLTLECVEIETEIIITSAIGLSPGGSSPTLVQTKIKIHKTTTKHKKHNKYKYINRTQKM
jgi:hypothetical protein